MSLAGLENCTFQTERLQVAPWHDVDRPAGLTLTNIVAQMLTDRSTMALPQSWRGDYSAERARAWIEERDRESPTLLAIERTSGSPLGLVLLREVALDHHHVDIRLGYVISEAAWGHGVASELVGGFVAWADRRPEVSTITAGVDTANPASARVLLKNGFALVDRDGADESTYQWVAASGAR